MSFISKTVRDRAISEKFWTPGVPRTTPLLHLKNFDFPEFWPPSFGGNGKYHLSQKP